MIKGIDLGYKRCRRK